MQNIWIDKEENPVGREPYGVKRLRFQLEFGSPAKMVQDELCSMLSFPFRVGMQTNNALSDELSITRAEEPGWCASLCQKELLALPHQRRYDRREKGTCFLAKTSQICFS